MTPTKTLLIAACLSAVSGAVLASPFIVSDPLDNRSTQCGFAPNAGAERVYFPVAAGPVAGQKICKMDLADMPSGTYSVTATAVADLGSPWGRMESVPSLPFALVVPTKPVRPSGFSVVP